MYTTHSRAIRLKWLNFRFLLDLGRNTEHPETFRGFYNYHSKMLRQKTYFKWCHNPFLPKNFQFIFQHHPVIRCYKSELLWESLNKFQTSKCKPRLKLSQKKCFIKDRATVLVLAYSSTNVCTIF
jgi:hypothetical protein